MEVNTKREFYINFDHEQDHSIGYLYGILNDTRTTTLLTIRNFSSAELDWQYKAGWNTIGALLLHISAVEHFFRIVYIENRELTVAENIELTPALDMGVHIPSLITGKEIDSYMHELSVSRQKLVESLKHVTFEDFNKTFESKDYGSTCNMAWILFHMIEDEIYHRGQISMIKKLMAETKKA